MSPAGLSLKHEHLALLQLAEPYLAGLDPQRISRLRRALEQLQIVQDEGVALTMSPLDLTR